jgi:MobA/MobL family
MATYFLRTKHVSRGKGARVTQAAAYRAGERIRDERTSEVYDYSDRRDVAYKEVILPAELSDRPDMVWTQDRSTLWNAAEHAGLRRNSRLAREWLVLIPPELSPTERTNLVRTFASELADKYRCAVDVCIHLPRPGADPRNHHAHLLMTTREVTPEGLGARTTLERGGRERRRAGLGPSRDEYLMLRERWAEVTNEALRQAGISARGDHRSLERQGIDREPVPTIPEKVFYAERRTQGRSAAGDAIRARHRERAEARRIPGEQRTRVLERQKEQLRERALEFKVREAQPKRVRWGALTRAERNEHRRARYQVRRALEKQDPIREAQRRESARLRERARWQANPEAVREARRRWREAHADEVNRKQREYRHARRAAALSQPSAATAAQSARNWKSYRNRHAPGPTAEESARGWLKLRETQAPPGASSPAASRASPPALERGSDTTHAAGLNPPTGPDHGHGL